jgi:hypothetical protein
VGLEVRLLGRGRVAVDVDLVSDRGELLLGDALPEALV